jgi:hypothetical protein
MILCDNQAENDILVIQFLRIAEKRMDLAAILSKNPNRYATLAKKKQSVRKSFMSGSLVLLNKNEIFEFKDPVARFSHIFSELLSKSRKEGRHLSFLGEVPPPSYVRFDLEKELENILGGIDFNPRPFLLCLYEKEGIASLKPADLLSIYQSHDSIFLNSIVLRRRPPR